MINPKVKSVLFFIFGFFLISFSELISQTGNSNMEKFEKVLDGLNFPEGPAWDGKGNLYVSNCHGGFITKISGDSSSVFLKASENPFTLNKTNGLTFFKDGSLFACEFGVGKMLKISPDGKTEIYADGYKGKRFNRPNDLAFDSKGNLYFTDPNSYGSDILDGMVYKVDYITKEVTPVADSIAFSNGIAFSADEKYAYVCESALNRVIKYAIDENGVFYDKHVFIDLPGGDPDGIAFDIDGNLYIAHFGGGKIYVVSPEGKIIKTYDTPGKKPSNLEFAGDDMKTLFLTEDETNAVYKIRVETPGLKLFCAPY
jgi:gluconolactonase